MAWTWHTERPLYQGEHPGEAGGNRWDFQGTFFLESPAEAPSRDYVCSLRNPNPESRAGPQKALQRPWCVGVSGGGGLLPDCCSVPSPGCWMPLPWQPPRIQEIGSKQNTAWALYACLWVSTISVRRAQDSQPGFPSSWVVCCLHTQVFSRVCHALHLL